MLPSATRAVSVIVPTMSGCTALSMSSPHSCQSGVLKPASYADGVSPALIEGRRRILIVSDDGTEAQGRFARFLMLDPQLLQIER